MKSIDKDKEISFGNYAMIGQLGNHCCPVNGESGEICIHENIRTSPGRDDLMVAGVKPARPGDNERQIERKSHRDGLKKRISQDGITQFHSKQLSLLGLRIMI